MGSQMIKQVKAHIPGGGPCELNKCCSRLRKTRKRIGQKQARRVLEKDMKMNAG
jgi:hypothetical protein